MKKYNYIVSVVMLLLSGYIFYESGGYTIGSSAQKNPAVWPCILAGALALLSVALIIETALKKEPGEEKKAIDWKSPGMIHVYNLSSGMWSNRKRLKAVAVQWFACFTTVRINQKFDL